MKFQIAIRLNYLIQIQLYWSFRLSSFYTTTYMRDKKHGSILTPFGIESSFLTIKATFRQKKRWLPGRQGNKALKDAAHGVRIFFLKNSNTQKVIKFKFVATLMLDLGSRHLFRWIPAGCIPLSASLSPPHCSL